jgi:hypothetical protein
MVVSFPTDGDIRPVKSDLIRAVHNALQGEPSRRATA